ncbi:MAG: cation transporter [Planctomycetota bacterium]|nr:MAG: cation transporter [Planctomycetota bacterium]
MHLGPVGHPQSCSSTGAHVRIDRWLALGLGLNVALVIGEALFGWWAGSMALIADAGHNLSDVLGLFISWWAIRLSRLSSHGRWTYGKRGFTMLADAGISLAVVLGGILVAYTDWYWVDPALSLAISAALLLSTWRLLSRSTTMMLQAAPSEREVEEIRAALLDQPEVDAVLDLHVWNVSTTDLLLTARIRAPSLSSLEHDAFLERLRELLKTRFGICHATIEVVHQDSEGHACVLEQTANQPP